jgi:putative membrane protein
MTRLILRWAINAVALYVAIGTGWINGIEAQDTSLVAVFALALVYSVVNALLRPLLKLVTCPVLVLTLGLFTLVINAVLFWLTGLLGQLFDIGFTVSGVLPAFIGGLVVGGVSAILTLLLRDELKTDRDRYRR